MNNGIPIKSVDGGKFIPQLDYESFFESLYISFNEFAIDMAQSEIELDSDRMTTSREDVNTSLMHMEESGYNTEGINRELQARYQAVLNDCLLQMATLVQATVYRRYTSQDVNKPRIIYNK